MGHPDTIPVGRGAHPTPPAPPVFAVGPDGQSVRYRGRYMGPIEGRLLLNHLRREDRPADDWFGPYAARLADELAAAMEAAGYTQGEPA